MVVVWVVQSMVQILTTLGELQKVHWGRVGASDQIGSGVILFDVHSGRNKASVEAIGKCVRQDGACHLTPGPGIQHKQSTAHTQTRRREVSVRQAVRWRLLACKKALEAGEHLVGCCPSSPAPIRLHDC